jgi:hypothetical protein
MKPTDSRNAVPMPYLDATSKSIVKILKEYCEWEMPKKSKDEIYTRVCYLVDNFELTLRDEIEHAFEGDEEAKT